MSLNWSVKNVKDNEALWVEGTDPWTNEPGHFINSKTESLIWFSMIAGLRSEITEDSAADWYARIALYERLNGVYCRRRGEDGTIVDDPITPADIERNIGLTTNGWYGTKESWGQYVKRITQHDERDAKRKYSEATAKADVA